MTNAEAERRIANAMKTLMDTPQGRDVMGYLLDVFGWQPASAHTPHSDDGKFMYDMGFKRAGEWLFGDLMAKTEPELVFIMLRERADMAKSLSEGVPEDADPLPWDEEEDS